MVVGQLARSTEVKTGERGRGHVRMRRRDATRLEWSPFGCYSAKSLHRLLRSSSFSFES